MKKGHELKIRERLSKSYLQVIFIASISAIVGIIALLVMTRMYNNALNNYGFSQGDIGKAMTAFSGARSEVRAAVVQTLEVQFSPEWAYSTALSGGNIVLSRYVGRNTVVNVPFLSEMVENPFQISYNSIGARKRIQFRG